MPSVRGTRYKRWMLRRRPAIGALSALALLVCAASADAWTSPQPLYVGASRAVFSMAGDNSGNAWAVLAGDSADRPLLLTERFASGEDAFIWGGARPFPGGQRYFTTGGLGLSSFVSAAAGDGSGLIAWRDITTGGVLLKAMVRETPQRFETPVMIAGADFGAADDVAAAVNPAGDAIVAFRRGGPRATGRTAFVSRTSPGGFRRARTLTPSATSAEAASIGGDGAAVVAWIRSTKVEASRIDNHGVATKSQRVGTARASGGLTTALSPTGAGVLAWQDEDGAIRLVRRSAPGRFSLSLPVRLGARDARVDGFSSAVDVRGRAFVAWRERRGQDRKLYVATAPVGGEFAVTQLVSGKGLGVPTLTARPSAGAVVSWRSPAGWQARIAPRSGVFAPATTVSKPLDDHDQTVARAAALAGPGPRVDLFWPQTTPDAPDIVGDLIYQSYDLQEPIG